VRRRRVADGDAVRVLAAVVPVVFYLDQGAFGDFSVDKPALLS
jgi:hypothetical protein